jgi:hypothetical protein
MNRNVFAVFFFFFLLLTAMFFFIQTYSTVRATPVDDSFLYLPSVQKSAQPVTPTPTPIPAERPFVYTTTLTIPSYNLDVGFIPTDPTDLVYPYPRLNHDWVFQAPQISRDFTAIVLENSYVSITILPELGGRLYRWQDKVTGRQLLYENPILKPTGWGWRGWWLATGGIEWAFPTDEHGLNEWRPWSSTIISSTDTISVTVSDVESQTGMTVGSTITLDSDHAYMTLTPFVENGTAVSHNYQYWLNAMIALNNNHVSADTQFIIPTDEVVIHSTGDSQVPDEHGVMSWPVYNNRALDSYQNWTNYIGFFAPKIYDGYTAVYDHTVKQGVVRVFDPTAIPGHKWFGPADLGSNLWTDDDSEYVEMWSSGVTTDFWTYASINPGEQVSWQERWYPVHEIDSINVANETAVLQLTDNDSSAQIGVSTTSLITGSIQLYVGGDLVESWAMVLDPGHGAKMVWERPSELNGQLGLRLLDEQSNVLIETGVLP